MKRLAVSAWVAAALVAVSAAQAADARPRAGTAYNPAVSLILDGRYASYARDPATSGIAGFSLAREAGEIDEGFHLGAAELTFSADIDPVFHGRFTAGVHDGEVEIEEAFIETLALGRGFTVRAGRFFAEVGYLNALHAHAWDFGDLPLPYRAMIGRHNLADDGVELRWVAPSALFVEIGAELFRGDAFPAGGAARDGKGAVVAFLRLGGDVGVSNAWRLGLSHYAAKAQERESGAETTPDLFTGDVDVTVVDVVWKWAPEGNARERNFKLQAEYLRRTEDGVYTLAELGGAASFRGTQDGWYAQAVYQFMPRWRIGVRHARADAGTAGPAFDGTVLDARGHAPRATSAMLDFSPSEFSRVRLQYTRDESRADAADDQWLLQYTVSLGAHGAHTF